MSLLPQRKKSAEELNQLRDQLGIPPQAPSQALPLATPPPPQPAPPAHTRSYAPQPIAPARSYAPPPIAPEAAPSRPPGPKPVRSLRKSERDPAPQYRTRQSSSSFSKIPERRHNTDEIQEMRRRDAMSRYSTDEHPLPFPLPAPRWITIPGYLLALSGLACHWNEIPVLATAGLGGLALLVSLYIFLRRPLSIHHAAFIGITTLLVLVFATLHYFPHLRHAS